MACQGCSARHWARAGCGVLSAVWCAWQLRVMRRRSHIRVAALVRVLRPVDSVVSRSDGFGLQIRASCGEASGYAHQIRVCHVQAAIFLTRSRSRQWCRYLPNSLNVTARQHIRSAASNALTCLRDGSEQTVSNTVVSCGSVVEFPPSAAESAFRCQAISNGILMPRLG